MGMDLLIDKDSGNCIWTNNSVEEYGCSCVFATEEIAKAYIAWCFVKYGDMAKWESSINKMIDYRNEFLNLVSTCSVCKQDLESDDIDNALVELGSKKIDWYDFTMKCETCIEKELQEEE